MANRNTYLLNPFLNYKSIFPAEGFKSRKFFISGCKSVDINIFCTVDSRLVVKGYDLPHQNSNNGNAGSKTLYDVIITPNSSYYKVFTPKSSYIEFEVQNTNQVQGLLLFQGYSNFEKEFSSQSHLEGKIFENDNCLLVREASDFKTDLIEGNISYAKQVNINGFSDSNNNGNSYTLGYQDLSEPFYPAVPETMYITCLSLDDVPGGSGAERVEIEYIDSNFNLVTAQFDTASNASLGVAAHTVNRVAVVQSGNSLSNQGLIKIENQSGNLCFAAIKPTENISLCGNYQVPIGQTLIVKELNIHGVSSGSKITIMKYDTSNNQLIVLGKYFLNTDNTNSVCPLNLKIEQQNKIMVIVSPDPIVSTEYIYCKMDCELVKNKGNF